MTLGIVDGRWTMAGWVRHGLPAGISTGLAFSAGALTNVFTQGWSWPVGVGLGVLVVAWVGWEMRQAAGRQQTRPELGREGVVNEGHHRLIPRQLPAVTRHLAGREPELDALAGALRLSRAGDGGSVVVTIAGTAGVGKTTLAVNWAHSVAEHFPDGQLYVNLQGFDPSGSAMPPAEALRGFLDALGVAPQRVPIGLADQAALYRSLLATRRMLVVLDNARDTEQVRPLLPGSSGSLALVTSRHELSGLAATVDARALKLDLLTESAARRLLADRIGAQRVEAEPHAITDIVIACARLPLALALAAAHAAARPTFALSTLATQLHETRNRLDLVPSDDPLTDARAMLSWSYAAVGPAAAQLFRLLALHPGPDISVKAAASLAAAPAARVRRTLAELDRSHLVTEHAPERYTFHDLLRAYAYEQAHDADTDQQRQDAFRRVLDHYLHTAHGSTMLLDPHRDRITLDAPLPGTVIAIHDSYAQAQAWFATEHHNLLAAVDQAFAAGLDVYVWKLAWALDNHLSLAGRWADLASVGRTAVAASMRLNDPHALARAHRNLAHAYMHLAQLSQAETHLHTAIGLHRSLHDLPGHADAHIWLARLRARQNRCHEALDHAQQAFQLYQSADDPAWQADALNAIGWYHAMIGDQQQAITFRRQALAIFAAIDDRRGQAWTWHNLGDAYRSLGDHPLAIQCYRNCLDLCRTLGDRDGQAVILNYLGDTYQAAGDLEAAHTAWNQALHIAEELQRTLPTISRAKMTNLEKGRTPLTSVESQRQQTTDSTADQH